MAPRRSGTLPPAGIEQVIVGGTPVVRVGLIVNGVFPGRAIRATSTLVDRLVSLSNKISERIKVP